MSAMAYKLMSSVTLTLVLVMPVLCLASLHVPPEPLGLVLGEEGPSPCTVDVFLDPICPDSRQSFRQLRPLLTKEDLVSRIRFRLLLFPLPYHRASFLACTAVKAVEDLSNVTVATEYLARVFEQLENFRTDVLVARNDNDVTRSLADLAEPLGLGVNSVVDMMNGDTRQDVITEFKIGCSRGVNEVPAFFINDVPTPHAVDWNKDAWVSVLSRLCR